MTSSASLILSLAGRRSGNFTAGQPHDGARRAVPPGAKAEAARQAEARLRQRLKEETTQVWYGSEETVLGRVFFAATGKGLVSVEWGLSEREFLKLIRSRFGAQAERRPDRVRNIGAQLREYLAGKRARFDLPLDLRHLPAFQRQVLLTARKIPRGQVKTYGEIARLIGRPKASRAVGQALGRNPIPLVIPCHRVIGADGALHGYGGGGGLRTKAWLLRLEGAHLRSPEVALKEDRPLRAAGKPAAVRRQKV